MNATGTMSPMVPLGSSDSMNEEQLRNVRIAMSKGYRFIQLIHNISGSIAERVYPVDGILVRIRHNSATKTNEATVTQKEGREVLFVPDPETGVRSANLLDTPHNRRFLATHLLENRWTIADSTIQREIQEIADGIAVEIDTSKMHESASSQTVVTHEDVVKGMSDTQLKQEIEAKKKELELLEQTKSEKAPETEDKDAPEDGQLVEKSVSEAIPPDILEKATSIVYSRNSSIIKKLKAEFGNKDFITASEYKKKIKPQINSEILKAMNEAQGAEPEMGAANADDQGVDSGTTV